MIKEAPTHEEEEAYLAERDRALIEAGTRGLTATAKMLTFALVFALLPLVPGASSVLGVSLRQSLLVVGAIVAALLNSTAAFHLGGFSSAWFRASILVDAITICSGSLLLVFWSGSAVSLFWLWHGAYIAVNHAVHFRRIHLPVAALTPAALAASFLARGQPGDAAASLFVGGAIVFVYEVTWQGARRAALADLRRTRVERRLAEVEAELRRARLARDLHDGLGAELSAILWMARDALASVDTREKALHEIEDASATGLEELREALAGLQTRSVSWAEFTTHLRSRAARLCEPGIRFELIDEPAGPRPELPAACWTQLTRAALEAVRNAVRHAEAREIKILLRVSDQLLVEITDDGRGLPEGSAASSHGGLANLRARAADLGAEVRIAPAERGTRVSFFVPLPSLLPHQQHDRKHPTSPP